MTSDREFGNVFKRLLKKCHNELCHPYYRECRSVPTDMVVTKCQIQRVINNVNSHGRGMYRSADKSLARPTSRFILFDVENISFDASFVLYIYIYIYTHTHTHTYIYRVSQEERTILREGVP
jgi:hypothetical protein